MSTPRHPAQLQFQDPRPGRYTRRAWNPLCRAGHHRSHAQYSAGHTHAPLALGVACDLAGHLWVGARQVVAAPAAAPLKAAGLHALVRPQPTHWPASLQIGYYAAALLGDVVRPSGPTKSHFPAAQRNRPTTTARDYNAATSLLPGPSALTPPRPRLPHASASNPPPPPCGAARRWRSKGTARPASS